MQVTKPMQVQKPAKKEKNTEDRVIDDYLITELVRCGVEEPAKVVEEFDLTAIGEDYDVLARPIAKKIHDRIDNFVGLLENFLQPDTNIASMNEIGFVDEQEMLQIIRSYRSLMRVLRFYSECDLHATREAYAKFIVQSLEAWNREKPLLLRITRKLQEGWSREQPLQREQRGYFG